MRLRLQNNRVVIPKESTRFGVVRLTLAELEVLTCFGLTRFLTLNLTSVTSHEAFCLQRSLVFRIDFHQRTSDSETQCLCLAFEATAVKRYLDIVLLCYAEFVQRTASLRRPNALTVSMYFYYLRVLISICLGCCACILCSAPAKMYRLLI